MYNKFRDNPFLKNPGIHPKEKEQTEDSACSFGKITINLLYLSQNIFGEYKVASGVLAVFSEYSLCG